MALSPLFRPEEISKNFGVFWTNGTSAILTWKGRDTTPVPAEFLRGYVKQIVHTRLGANPTLAESYPISELDRILRDIEKPGGLDSLRKLRWD